MCGRYKLEQHWQEYCQNPFFDWDNPPYPFENPFKASEVDPDARLYRKGMNIAAVLCYQGHVLMENRSGLVVGAVVTHADGYGERAAALAMLDTLPGKSRKTIGADKGYAMRDFVAACRERGITPHVAAHRNRGGIDGRTTRHRSYEASQIVRKRIEEHFGWGKTSATSGRPSTAAFDESISTSNSP